MSKFLFILFLIILIINGCDYIQKEDQSKELQEQEAQRKMNEEKVKLELIVAIQKQQEENNISISPDLREYLARLNNTNGSAL